MRTLDLLVGGAHTPVSGPAAVVLAIIGLVVIGIVVAFVVVALRLVRAHPPKCVP